MGRFVWKAANRSEWVRIREPRSERAKVCKGGMSSRHRRPEAKDRLLLMHGRPGHGVPPLFKPSALLRKPS